MSFIEDACGESPAASLDRVCSLPFYIINRSVFVFIRAVFVHYVNCCILERCYGFVGRFLGLLGVPPWMSRAGAGCCVKQ